MAGFRTHITTSTVLGIAYGGTAALVYEVPLPACLLAGGLCGVSGMLPDLDSGPGVPLRESVAFAAAVVPMLMIDRFRHLGMSPESMVLAGAAIYLGIRFGIGRLLKHMTVHRGMFHSLPAMLIAGELAFLLCAREELAIRYFFAGAVMLGFLSHLVLDEIWSIDFRHFRLKSSFGTALKFWGECGWANVSTYLNVVILSLLVFQDPVWMQSTASDQENAKQMAGPAVEHTLQ